MEPLTLRDAYFGRDYSLCAHSVIVILWCLVGSKYKGAKHAVAPNMRVRIPTLTLEDFL